MAGWRTTFGTLAAGNQALNLFDEQNNDVGLLTIVPCTATGTNSIALAPEGFCAVQSAYANYQRYGFVAANTTTGSVTINVNSLGALNAYAQDGTTQLGANDIVAGRYYDVVYNSALNASAGGFALVSPAPLYEEGSWTPAAAGSTSTGTLTGTTIVGRYIRVGNQVTVWGRIAWTGSSGTWSGNAEVTGLPFTSSNVSGLEFDGTFIQNGFFGAAGHSYAVKLGANSAVLVLWDNSNAAAINTGSVGFLTSSSDISFSLTYRIN